MISVVVPNLNEKRYLWEFLGSLAAQSYKDFELIIIDGGSTDGSRDLIDVFAVEHPEIPITKLLNETRNIGFIRNLGARAARGDILFHTSSDVILEPSLLLNIEWEFFNDHNLISLTGRTKPISNKILCHVAYQGFDLLRWIFSRLPGTLRKYRPGGNFFALKKNAFDYVGGFPEVPINEDGLLGQKLDQHPGWGVKFDLGLCVHHHVKRFEERGSIKTLLFYLYVLGNLFPMLKPLLYKIEAHSAEVFKSRSDLRDFR